MKIIQTCEGYALLIDGVVRATALDKIDLVLIVARIRGK